jgi:hypothetical protein
MLLDALRIAKDWAKKKSQTDGSLLSRLWSFLSVVPKGQALSLVILSLVASHFSQIYDNQITAISILATVILIWKGRQWLRWPLLCFAGYLVFASLWHFGVDDGLSPKLQAVTAAVTGRQTLFVILSGLAALTVAASVNLLAPLFLIFGSILTLLGYPILTNPSTNAAMIVLCLPYCRKWWMWLVTLCVVAQQQGATAWLMFAAISLVTLARHSTKTVISLSVMTGLGLALLTWHVRPSFFLFFDRWDEYQLAARFWWENINPWIGAGLGTFQVLGPAMQKWDGRAVTEVWMSLHSDILQLVFETGVIGAGLAAWLVIDSLFRTDGKTRLAMIAACLFGLFYFPMQIPLVAFFLILIVVRAQSI